MTPIRCDCCLGETANPENEYGEYICTSCEENRNERQAEAAYERMCEDGPAWPSLLDQQKDALRYK
jgi:hypothetical protein